MESFNRLGRGGLAFKNILQLHTFCRLMDDSLSLHLCLVLHSLNASYQRLHGKNLTLSLQSDLF